MTQRKKKRTMTIRVEQNNVMARYKKTNKHGINNAMIYKTSNI